VLLLLPGKLYRDGFALLCFPGGTLPGYPGKLMTWMTWHKKTHIIVGFVLRTYNPYVVSFELV
jgi:hypothetical protein